MSQLSNVLRVSGSTITNVKPSKQQLCNAYRHLYRGLLHAVQYSKPARYVARDTLRNSFRKENPSNFDQKKIDKTLVFLEFAAQEKGLEHRILKSILHTKFWEMKEGHIRRGVDKTLIRTHARDTARIHYNMTITMLNKTMGLCLR